LECIGINLTSSSIVLLGVLTHHLPENLFSFYQDVAVKVYFANGYTEANLQDYKKEVYFFFYCLRKKQTTETFVSLRQVDIMKRLRHPNVLLFMGAIYSQEKHAIVTELLPR
jgi:hypothetical protein